VNTNTIDKALSAAGAARCGERPQPGSASLTQTALSLLFVPMYSAVRGFWPVEFSNCRLGASN
jgi:hypothetical protein